MYIMCLRHRPLMANIIIIIIIKRISFIRSPTRNDLISINITIQRKLGGPNKCKNIHCNHSSFRNNKIVNLILWQKINMGFIWIGVNNRIADLLFATSSLQRRIFIRSDVTS